MATPLRLLGALVLAGALLRFTTLDVQSFWRDEASTVVDVDGSLGHLWERIRDLEGMPPLSFALFWPWSKVFGDGEVALRALSALLGTLTIPVAWALARRIAPPGRGDAAGLIAAALAATAPFLVWYSQEARTYALLIALCAAATVRFLDALEAPSRRHLLQWGLLTAGGLGAHYFAGFLLIPQAVVLLWRQRGAALPAVAIPLVAGVALLPLLLSQRDNGVDWVSESSLASRVGDVAKHWVAGPFGTPADALGAAGVLLLGAGAVLAVVRGRGRILAGVVAAAVAGPVALAALGEDYVLDRYLVGALVPLLALAGAGFAEPPRWLAAAGAALALLFAGFTVATVLDEQLHREDWRTVAERLPEGPLALVVTRDGEPPLDVYLERAVPLGAPVEVLEIATAASHRFGRARPATPPPPPGFTLLERREDPTTTVVRYAAETPTPVDAATLAPLALDAGEPPALIALPGA